MSFLHLDAGRVSIRKYSAATVGKKSVVKIEIEIADHDDLSDMLRQLERAKGELTKVKARSSRTASAESQA